MANQRGAEGWRHQASRQQQHLLIGRQAAEAAGEGARGGSGAVAEGTRCHHGGRLGCLFLGQLGKYRGSAPQMGPTQRPLSSGATWPPLSPCRPRACSAYQSPCCCCGEARAGREGSLWASLQALPDSCGFSSPSAAPKRSHWGSIFSFGQVHRGGFLSAFLVLRVSSRVAINDSNAILVHGRFYSKGTHAMTRCVAACLQSPECCIH